MRKALRGFSPRLAVRLAGCLLAGALCMKSLSGTERLPDEQAYRRPNCHKRGQRTVLVFITEQRTPLRVPVGASRKAAPDRWAVNDIYRLRMIRIAEAYPAVD